MGRHCQYSKSKQRLAISTYVLRSIGLGMILVHRSLNHCRAITLCWMAKSPNNRASMTSAGTEKDPTLESMDLGTNTLPTKPIAYKKVPKNIAYAANP